MTKENILNKKVEDLELDVRALRCFSSYDHGIKTVRDIVSKSEGELLRMPNFGRKSLTALKEILNSMELKMGMTEEEIQDKDMSVNAQYTNLNYDIIASAKKHVGKTIDAILNKHKWSYEDIDEYFSDHEKVLKVYKKSLKELFAND